MQSVFLSTVLLTILQINPGRGQDSSTDMTTYPGNEEFSKDVPYSVVCYDANFTIKVLPCPNGVESCHPDIEYYKGHCTYFVNLNKESYCHRNFYQDYNNKCIMEYDSTKNWNLVEELESSSNCTSDGFELSSNETLQAWFKIYSNYSGIYNKLIYSYEFAKYAQLKWIYTWPSEQINCVSNGESEELNFLCYTPSKICFGEANLIVNNLNCPRLYSDSLFDGFADYKNCFDIEFTTRRDVNMDDVFEPISLTKVLLFIGLARTKGLTEDDRCLVNMRKLNYPFILYNSVITMNREGEIFQDVEYNCIVKLYSVGSKLNLEFDANRHKLSLFVESEEPPLQLNCRNWLNPIENTISVRNESSWNLRNISKIIYDIDFGSSEIEFPGIYSCEKKNYTDFLSKYHSNDVIAYRETDRPAFVVGIESNIFVDGLPQEFYSRYQLQRIFTIRIGTLYYHSIYVQILNDVAKKVTFVDDYKQLIQIVQELESQNITLLFMRSVKYCFAEILPETPDFQWQTVLIGQRSTTSFKCLDESFLPYSRRCVGDAVSGGEWEPFLGAGKSCRSPSSLSEVTNELFNLEESLLNDPTTAPFVFSRLINITRNEPEKLAPVDLIQIATVIDLLGDVHNPVAFVGLIDKISHIKRETFVAAAQADLNSTNILLDALDHSVNAEANHDNEGLSIIRTKNLIVCSIDPAIKNISGIALYFNAKTRSNRDRLSLDNYHIRSLFMNQSVDQLLQDEFENLEFNIGAFVPEELYNHFISVAQNKQKLRVVITVFLTDKLFQTRSLNYVDKVISVSVPGFDKVFPVALPTIFKADVQHSCGFFNLDPPSTDSSLGAWNYEGCELMQSSTETNIAACGCFHLTHFTYLLIGGQLKHKDELYMDEKWRRYNAILEWISRVCCGLSLIGIFFIILTFIVFKRWQADLRNTIVLQFSIAIGIQIILIIIADSTVHSQKSFGECVLLGASLQYIILVTFSWMLLIAVRQYKRFVRVFNAQITISFILGSMAIGWGVPLIPTIISAAVAPSLYQPKNNDDICYPKNAALHYGLTLPIAIVVFVNLIIFIIVLGNIFKNVSIRKSTQNYEFAQLRVSLILFFLLGLTWLFGFLSTFESTMQLAFNYIFNITAPLQGFIIFIYYIILNPTTRLLWIKRIQNIYSNTSTYES